MRVLFTPFPARTHVNTQVPIAWALRSAGHQVCVATQPDVIEDVTAAGLAAVPIGDPLNVAAMMNGADDGDGEEADWLDVLDIGEIRPERLTYEYVHGVLTAWTSIVYQSTVRREVIAELVEFARDWRPDLVIWDTMYYAGSVAAMAAGSAHARLLFGLDLVGWMRQRYHVLLRDRPPGRHDDPLAEWLGPILEECGRGFAEEVVVGQWTVDPMPPSIRLPVDHLYVPVRYVPYNGVAAVPGWLRRPPERPRVCLTLGTSFRELVGGDTASVGELLGAMADLDVEVVATLNDGQITGLAKLPENVRIVDYVPLDLLLPTCSAIVHHGGSGTVATALAHGVPQVMVPARMWCNLPKARLVERAGAGLCREAGEPSVAELRDMLLRVLREPSFAAGAARLRREMLGAPTPGDIVPVLERLAATP